MDRYIYIYIYINHNRERYETNIYTNDKNVSIIKA